jgi:glycosyltransferase involved in cell wall biosynthesis
MIEPLPLVSVIVPVHNGAGFIAQAIDSILAQGYHPLELIAIDDGSSDATAEILCRYADRVRYVRQNNQGPAAARNHGLHLAKGEIIAFLDADDRWPAARLRRHVSILAERKDIGLVIGPSRFFLDEAEPQSVHRHIPPAPIVQPQLGSATFRRTLFDRVGRFNEAMRFAEDLDWFKRAMAMKVPIRISSPVALEYRVRAGSLSDGRVDFAPHFLGALRGHLHRKRARKRNSPLDPGA